MTIVVALQDDEGVLIGCDMLSQGGGIVFSRNERKWIEHECGIWVGFAGALDVVEILRDLTMPVDTPNVEQFCDRLRSELREQHWEPKKDEQGGAPTWELSLLLTDGSALWEAGSPLYPARVASGDPRAIGCGYQLALGAMMVSKEEKHCAGDVILCGLEAAIHYDVHCGGDPWTYRVVRK